MTTKLYRRCWRENRSENTQGACRTMRRSVPSRVLPMVELVMGYPDEDFPPRPRYPLDFTLFEGEYPSLSDDQVRLAVDVMDEGYLAQDYYKHAKAKIALEDGRPDSYDYDSYSWTEHISRKWGQWMPDAADMLGALRERGFDLRPERDTAAEAGSHDDQ